MRELGERLCKPLEHTTTKWVDWLNEVPKERKFPLVLASFVLREIPESDKSKVLSSALSFSTEFFTHPPSSAIDC